MPDLFKTTRKEYGMSEIREELEHFAKLAEEQAVKEEAKSQTETSENNDKKDSSEEENIKAPKGYSKEFAENFAKLPKEWREYLSAREEEIDKGFSNLRSRNEIDKHLEDVYAKRIGELQKYGIRTQDEWLKNLVRMDEMLSSRPLEAMNMLAEMYNIRFSPAPASAMGNNQDKNNPLQALLLKKEIDDFAAAVNEKGEKEHPFFHEVVREMSDLLSGGLVQNIREAYEQAVWFNPSTRSKLLAKRTQDTLELKSKDAKKAKETAFTVNGKTVPDTKDLTLREELEMRFAALTDNDF